MKRFLLRLLAILGGLVLMFIALWLLLVGVFHEFCKQNRVLTLLLVLLAILVGWPGYRLFEGEKQDDASSDTE